MENRYATYKAFWPFYVHEHQKLSTRRLHFVGTALVLLCLLAFLFTLNPYFLLVMPFCGYSFAWASHFFCEKNRPATFQYPIWSLRADFHMFFLMCLGRMNREVNRMGVLNAERNSRVV